MNSHCILAGIDLGADTERIVSYSACFSGGYDLVVMGASGLSYIQGLLVGSTTESVLRSSPCPVLIVH